MAQRRITTYFNKTQEKGDQTASTVATPPPLSPVLKPTECVKPVDREDATLAPATQLPAILTAPFQLASFNFPGRCCGSETFCRSFTPSWFNRWRWLHYETESDRVFCFPCLSVKQRKLMPDDSFRADSAFVINGFGNWRKATVKFNEHERSKLHRDCVQRIAALDNVPINALLSDAISKQQATARHVLELLFRTVRFLGSKGIPFRGDPLVLVLHCAFIALFCAGCPFFM